MPPYSQQIIDAVRSHKQKATPAEILMEQKLRFHRILFVREYPVLTEKSFFTADFFIPKHHLLIEVDGCIHDDREQMKKDFVKDMVYKSMGYNVLRIKNEDVDTFDTLSIKKFRRRKLVAIEDNSQEFKRKRLKQKWKNR